MPTITVTVPGGSGSATVDPSHFTAGPGFGIAAPFDVPLSNADFQGIWDLDVAEIPEGSIFRITGVSGTFAWSITAGDAVDLLAGQFEAVGTIANGDGTTGLIAGGVPRATSYAPFPTGDSGGLTMASLPFVVKPVDRSVPWYVTVIWRNGGPSFTTSTIAFTLSSVDLTIDYTTGTAEGTLSPHLELSETQEAHGPLPATATIEATIEDDDDSIFAGATIEWELIGAPSEASGFSWASVLIQDPDALATAVHFTEYRQGTYVFQITATATTGETLIGTATVTIGPAMAPRVENGLFVIHYPETITVNPEVIDYGWNGPLTFLWEQLSGPTATIVSPTTQATELTFPEMDGSYVFQLTVSNDLLSGTGITKIVQRANIAPAPLAGGQLYVTIAGIEYARGR